MILGAGAASRMGRSKLTLPYGSSTVVETVIARLAESSVDKVVLVTGHHAAAVEAAVAGSVQTTRNPDPDRGNFSSLSCGVEALGESVDGVLVVVGDMPGIDARVVNALVDAYISSTTDAVVAAYTDGWGHPVVVSRGLIARLDASMAQPLWRGIKNLSPDDRIELKVKKVKPVDINTPADHLDAVRDT